MREPALRAYNAVPDPKIVIAFGACGCTGGIFHDYYAVWGGAEALFPVDVYVPGCPPHPRVSSTRSPWPSACSSRSSRSSITRQRPDERVSLKHTNVSSELRITVEREARRMSGYLQGGQIADMFLELLGTEGPAQAAYRLGQYLGEQKDPRLNEIMQRLFGLYLEAGNHRDPGPANTLAQFSTLQLNPTHRRDPRLQVIMQQLSAVPPATVPPAPGGSS